MRIKKSKKSKKSKGLRLQIDALQEEVSTLKRALYQEEVQPYLKTADNYIGKWFEELQKDPQYRKFIYIKALQIDKYTDEYIFETCNIEMQQNGSAFIPNTLFDWLNVVGYEISTFCEMYQNKEIVEFAPPQTLINVTENIHSVFQDIFSGKSEIGE